MLLKFISKFSENLCYCYNVFINHFVNDGINKGILKIGQISILRENKELPYIVQITKKKCLYYFDENVIEIMDKVESKKKTVSNTEKDNKNEGNNNDQVIKK